MEPAERPEDFTVVRGVEGLKALAHEVRLGILRNLREEPATAAEVGRALGLTAQKAGYHISKLEAAGLVRFVRTGRKRWKEERLWLATGRHYLVDPALACDDPAARARLAAEVEQRFQAARLREALGGGHQCVARRVVEDALALAPGQRLLVLTGPFTMELATAVVVAAEARGATAVVHPWGRAYVLGRLDAASAEELAGAPLFPAGLTAELDAVCQLTSSIVQGPPPSEVQRAKLPHLLAAVTAWQRDLRERGVPHLEVSVPCRADFLPSASPEAAMDTFWRAVDHDSASTSARVEALGARLEAASELTLRDGLGGELTLGIVPRPGTRDEPPRAPSLPAGGRSVLVRAGTARGALTAAYVQVGGRHLETPRLTLADGRLVGLSGRPEDAADLAAVTNRLDAESGTPRDLAYLTVGACEAGEALTGKTSLDSVLAGVVTLSFGSDAHLGGERSATLDLSFPVDAATLLADGDALVLDGCLRIA